MIHHDRDEPTKTDHDYDDDDNLKTVPPTPAVDHATATTATDCRLITFLCMLHQPYGTMLFVMLTPTSRNKLEAPNHGLPKPRQSRSADRIWLPEVEVVSTH